MESRSVASGCGCKEIYRFPHITSPYILLFSLVSVLSCSSNNNKSKHSSSTLNHSCCITPLFFVYWGDCSDLYLIIFINTFTLYVYRLFLNNLLLFTYINFMLQL